MLGRCHAAAQRRFRDRYVGRALRFGLGPLLAVVVAAVAFVVAYVVTTLVV